MGDIGSRQVRFEVLPTSPCSAPAGQRVETPPVPEAPAPVDRERVVVRVGSVRS